MQTIIMTVGTSIRTNADRDLPDDKKRPWINNEDKFKDKRIFSNINEPLAWMETTEPELISAETNTLWRLDIANDDRVLLYHFSMKLRLI